MLGTSLLLGCIYVQSNLLSEWIKTFPIITDGVLTHQTYKNGLCNSYIYRLPWDGTVVSGKSDQFLDPKLFVSASTNNALGLINSFSISIVFLPFYYNGLFMRPLKLCNSLYLYNPLKFDSYFKRGVKDDKFGNRYLYYLITVCPGKRRGNESNKGRFEISEIVYPHRLGYIITDEINKSELYFNVSVTRDPLEGKLYLLFSLCCSVVASAILYQFV